MAVPPGEIEAVGDEPEATPTVKSSPVPVSVTSCGLPVALSAMLSVPAASPAAEGVKVTLIVQFELAASEDPQLLVSAKAATLVLILEIVSATLVVFESVTV